MRRGETRRDEARRDEARRGAARRGGAARRRGARYRLTVVVQLRSRSHRLHVHGASSLIVRSPLPLHRDSLSDREFRSRLTARRKRQVSE